MLLKQFPNLYYTALWDDRGIFKHSWSYPAPGISMICIAEGQGLSWLAGHSWSPERTLSLAIADCLFLNMPECYILCARTWVLIASASSLPLPQSRETQQHARPGLLPSLLTDAWMRGSFRPHRAVGGHGRSNPTDLWSLLLCRYLSEPADPCGHCLWPRPLWRVSLRVLETLLGSVARTRPVLW